jgi:ArsR family transcriptional regulator, arsenate/arsenite/antimonite-responsive transcriptional repressor
MKPMETKQAIQALGALAQDTRLDIFRLLVECGPEGLSAGLIAEKLDLPASSLSFHLAQLNHAGLISRRRDGTSLIYSVDFEEMRALMGYLMDNCCGSNAATCPPPRRPAPAPAQAIKRRKSA